MKPLSFYKNSLTSRLMLAFMLVAVPAVLMSSVITSYMVTRAFNKAIESWLRETMDYVISSMEDTSQELDSAFILLRQRFSEPAISISPEEEAAMRNLGIDYVIVRDASGSVIFSLGSVASIDERPLFLSGNITWLTTKEGKRQLVFASSRELESPRFGKRIVSFAETFSLDMYFAKERPPSFSLRIIIPEGNSFKEIYASREGMGDIQESVWNELNAGNQDYFLPDKNWTDRESDVHLFFKPFRDSAGAIQALFVIGVTMTDLEKFISDSSLLFWFLFFGGLLIAGSGGYILAGRIVRPIKDLDAGVACIAAGEFGYEVPAAGNDELAGLGRSFNQMSNQLAAMRRDRARSVKRERSRMLGEIAMGFAHEIRNPLLVIQASSQVLYGKLMKDANDTKLIGFVVEEVERINKLVSEFLGFAKPVEPDMVSASLPELINAAMALCQAKCERHNVDYIISRETEKDAVLCDPKQIQQVLLNLILNAIDAMPGGGVLAIRIYTADNRFCFDVADTGEGISAELLPTIHLPFVSTKKNGLGLGLSKVYAIIEEHGWNISCASVEESGTTFTISINN